MHVRVCRECGEEYRPEIAVCADCGGDLVDSHDDAPAAGSTRAIPERHAAEGEEEAELLYYSWTSARNLTLLADELVRVGLPFQIQLETTARQLTFYGLKVPQSRAAEARRVLAPVAERHPELDIRFVPAPMSDAEAEAEAEAERQPGSCPACEAHVPPDVAECPGCGLSLHIEDEERE